MNEWDRHRVLKSGVGREIVRRTGAGKGGGSVKEQSRQGGSEETGQAGRE